MTGGLLTDDIETLARRVVEENAALGRKVTVAESWSSSRLELRSSVGAVVEVTRSVLTRA